jgi:AcrR family transcriptional regulator
MPIKPGSNAERRVPLSRERVLRAAVAMADESGIDSLTMRRLGQELGVEAMSLYNHVANKDAILDGVVDLVLSDIEVPPTGTHWRRRCVSGRSRPTRSC